jgi:glycine cleavage system H lipoate-binding protein
MSDSGEHKNYPLIPPNELRCVWMTAGILSYQLCDRELDCERCPLDSALRQRFADKAALVQDEPRADAGGARTRGLHAEYQYGRKHTWVKISDRTTARIGIEPGLASVLLSPKTVVLPSTGERVHRNKVCAWIVMEGGTLPIVAPLDGEVKSTNAQLVNNPHALCDAPLDHGWLFDLSTDPGSLEHAELLGIAEAAKIYGADESRFQSLIAAEFTKGGSAAGLTLADGGQLLRSVSAMVGPTKYFRLVRDVFS